MLWFLNVHFKHHIVECCIMAVIINGETANDPFLWFQGSPNLDPDHTFPCFEMFIS